MAIIDIDRMYKEMRNTMEYNFDGTAKQRYKQAKALFLESVEECIEANKEELIEEYNQRLQVE